MSTQEPLVTDEIVKESAITQFNKMEEKYPDNNPSHVGYAYMLGIMWCRDLYEPRLQELERKLKVAEEALESAATITIWVGKAADGTDTLNTYGHHVVKCQKALELIREGRKE